MQPLQKGDIVAVHGQRLISLAIETITHSPISHVAIVEDPDKRQLIEAEIDRTIGYQSLDHYKEHCVILRVPSLTDEQREQVVQYAKAQLGDSYDFKAIVEEYLRYRFRFQMNQRQAEETKQKRFICSTLVNSAYLSVGIKLTDQYLPSPDDIFKSPFIALVDRF
jgi:uncharacterized protein YycO